VKGTQQSSAEEICFPTVSIRGLDRLIRVYGYVMAAPYKWRKKTGAQGPVIINTTEDRSHHKEPGTPQLSVSENGTENGAAAGPQGRSGCRLPVGGGGLVWANRIPRRHKQKTGGL
jgi:hypothetical protein